MEWKPIETAPIKESILVLTNTKEIFYAYSEEKGQWKTDDPKGGGWCYINGNLTHWCEIELPK